MEMNKNKMKWYWIKIAALFLLAISMSTQGAFATTTKHRVRTAQHNKSKPKTQLTHNNTNKRSRLAQYKLRKQKNRHHTIFARAHVGQTNQINNGNILHSNVPLYGLSNVEQRLVNFVRNMVSSLHYSNYKLGGTTIDESRGVYVTDCSTYVDHIVKTIYPRAYTSLVNATGTEKPTSDDYYDYFVNLADKPQNHWNMIDDVEKLRPGDILVFRFKNSLGIETGGHVMIVMDEPARNDNTFFVRVADSAPTGHSEDTRLPRRSGIGIGTLMLKVDPRSYQPYAYAWKAGARWERNVYVAMARPVDAG